MFKKLKQLKNHPGFIKYFTNTSWVFGEKILRITVGLLISIWLARYLGPEQFGSLSYAISFSGLFTVISSFGLNGIIVRELVKKNRNTNVILGTAFVLKLLGAFLALSMLCFATDFTTNDKQTNILILIIASATIFQSFNVIDFYFQSKVLSKYIVFANTIGLLISSIVKVTLILNGGQLLHFGFVILFDSFILALGFIYFYNHKKLSIKQWFFKFSMAKSLLKDSWPLIFSGIVVSINMKIDQVIIKQILGSEAVGQYAAAVRLSEAWYFIPMVICASLFPAIINSKKHSDILYYSRLQKLYDLMVWMAIIIAVPMTFMSEWVVDLLYGEQYNKAGHVLMIHIWAGIFVFLGQAFNRHLTAVNQTRKAFYRSSLGAVSNVILNYYLIPIYGINGAAFSTLACVFISNYLYDFLDRDLKKQRIMKTKSFFPIHLLMRKNT